MRQILAHSHTVPEADHSSSPAPGPAPAGAESAVAPAVAPAVEIGGPPGPDPTRYGDWERAGRCIDF